MGHTTTIQKPKAKAGTGCNIKPDMTSVFHVKQLTEQSLRGGFTMPEPTKKLGYFDNMGTRNLEYRTHDNMRFHFLQMQDAGIAGHCAEILTDVLNRFSSCGSEREALSLAVAIEDVLTRVAKP